MKETTMRYLVAFFLIFLCACSKGKDTIDVTPMPPVLVDQEYEFFDYTYGNYEGRCRRIDDKAYCFPKVIADSDYTVNATYDFSTKHLKIFDFQSWALKIDTIAILKVTKAYVSTDTSTDGYWSPSVYFNEDYIDFMYQRGELMGTSTQGCTVSGNTNGWTINVNLSGCSVAGDYQGLLIVSNGKITGMISNGTYGASILYEVN